PRLLVRAPGARQGEVGLRVRRSCQAAARAPWHPGYLRADARRSQGRAAMSPDVLADRLRPTPNGSSPDQGEDLARLLREVIELLRRQASAGPEPLTVPAAVAGPLCGVSEATWWRLSSSGKCPRPLKVGGKTLWRTAELQAWVAAGMPERRTWESLQ